MCQLGHNKKLAEAFPGLAHIKGRITTTQVHEQTF